MSQKITTIYYLQEMILKNSRGQMVPMLFGIRCINYMFNDIMNGSWCTQSHESNGSKFQ